MKYFNYKSYNFNKLFRKINLQRHYFLNYIKHIKFNKFNLNYIKYIKYNKFNLNYIKYIKFNKFNLKKTYKNLIYLQYEFLKIFKQKIYKYYKTSVIYLIGTTLALILIYLTIPFFYSYDKSNIESLICEDFEIKCNIKGEVYYNFIPTPRLVVKNVQVNNLFEGKTILAKLGKVEVVLPLKDLLKKSKKDLNKIQIEKAKFFVNYEKIDQYKNLFLNKKKTNVISFKKSDIDFFDGSKYITSINKINAKYKYKKNYSELTLKGIFLGDIINVDFKNNLNSEKKFNNKTQRIKLLDEDKFY